MRHAGVWAAKSNLGTGVVSREKEGGLVTRNTQRARKKTVRTWEGTYFVTTPAYRDPGGSGF